MPEDGARGDACYSTNILHLQNPYRIAIYWGIFPVNDEYSICRMIFNQRYSNAIVGSAYFLRLFASAVHHLCVKKIHIFLSSG